MNEEDREKIRQLALARLESKINPYLRALEEIAIAAEHSDIKAVRAVLKVLKSDRKKHSR